MRLLTVSLGRGSSLPHRRSSSKRDAALLSFTNLAFKGGGLRISPVVCADWVPLAKSKVAEIGHFLKSAPSEAREAFLPALIPMVRVNV